MILFTKVLLEYAIPVSSASNMPHLKKYDADVVATVLATSEIVSWWPTYYVLPHHVTALSP